MRYLTEDQFLLISGVILVSCSNLLMGRAMGIGFIAIVIIKDIFTRLKK